MSPHEFRNFACISLAFTSAVIFNAVVLQAPRAEQKPRAEVRIERKQAGQTGVTPAGPVVPPLTAVRAGAFQPTATAPQFDTLPTAPGAEGKPETTRAVQKALATLGYGPLDADGQIGLFTRAAILAFEADAGLPLAAEATETLLKELSAGHEPRRSTGAGRVVSVNAETLIRHVQTGLSQLGYLTGRVDGRLGEATQRAIRDFEQDQALPQRGRVASDVLVKLQKRLAQRTNRP